MAQLAYFATDQLPDGVSAGLEASGRYTTPRPFIWANATHICTCEVDIVTGQVTVLRYIVGEDCGPMINPNIVEGQIAGGSVQGIGGVLYEHWAFDDDGNPLRHHVHGLPAARCHRSPRHRVRARRVAQPGAGGFKGVGEGGAIGAPAAVVNAVADALSPFGVNVTHLPLGPADVVALLDGRAATAG